METASVLTRAVLKAEPENKLKREFIVKTIVLL